MSPELLGYIASALVAVSLLMSQLIRLRVINLAGAVVFIVYGIAISNIPILLTNGFIAVINIVHLCRLISKDSAGFEYLPVAGEATLFAERFLAAHRDDIRRYHPEFDRGMLGRAAESGGIYLAMDELSVEGLAVYLRPGDAWPEDTARTDAVRELVDSARSVVLVCDYITLAYRDFGLVHVLHRRLAADLLPEVHTVVLVTERKNRAVRGYVERYGFGERARVGGSDIIYTLKLKNSTSRRTTRGC